MGAAVTTGNRRAYSIGDLMMFMQPLVKVDDGSTHATSLHAVIGTWATITDVESTNTSNAGSDVGLALGWGKSGGTLTFNHGEADRNTEAYLLSTELE